MREYRLEHRASDGMVIHAYEWLPDEGAEIKGVVHIVHGSVEHIYRYKDFATYLTSRGFAVYGNDHRGHGKTAGGLENLSYMSDEKNGFDLTLEDLKRLNGLIKGKYPDSKVIMLGHSLGSFMLRKYACLYPDTYHGLILTGTGGGKKLMLRVGLALAGLLSLIKGRKTPSPLLHKMMYDPLNANVKNSNSKVDFISRDQGVVDAYLEDPYCGHLITVDYAMESLKGIYFCQKRASFALAQQVPLFILSGEEDLVGGKKGKEVTRVYEGYKKGGYRDIRLKLYPGCRHEILNELNKEEVYEDIYLWIEQRFC